MNGELTENVIVIIEGEKWVNGEWLTKIASD